MIGEIRNAKSPVSFPLEEKTCCDKRQALQEKFMTPHRKTVLAWCIFMSHVISLKQIRGIKNVSLKAAKKFVDVAVYREE